MGGLQIESFGVPVFLTQTWAGSSDILIGVSKIWSAFLLNLQPNRHEWQLKKHPK